MPNTAASDPVKTQGRSCHSSIQTFQWFSMSFTVKAKLLLVHWPTSQYPTCLPITEPLPACLIYCSLTAHFICHSGPAASTHTRHLPASQPHGPLHSFPGLHSADASTTLSSPTIYCSYIPTCFTLTSHLDLDSEVRLPLTTWYKIPPSQSPPRLHKLAHIPPSLVYFPHSIYTF